MANCDPISPKPTHHIVISTNTRHVIITTITTACRYTPEQLYAMHDAEMLEAYNTKMLSRAIRPLPLKDYYNDGYARRTDERTPHRRAKHLWKAMDSFDARGRPKKGGGWQHDTPGLNEPRMTRVQDHRTGSVREQRHWEWVGRDIAIERSLHPSTIYDQVHEDDVAYSETGRPGGRPHK